MTREEWKREFPEIPDENADLLIEEGFTCPHPLNMYALHPQGWELTGLEVYSEMEELRVLIAERKERHALTSRRA